MIQVDLKHYEKSASTEKLLTLVFAIVGRDKASELRFDYRTDEPSIRALYWVGDELAELVPPPAHLWPEIVQILLKDTEPGAGQKKPKATGVRRKLPFPDFPFAGKLPVQFAGKEIPFDILFFRGRTGEHIWVESDSKFDASQPAAEFFRQWREAGHGK